MKIILSIVFLLFAIFNSFSQYCTSAGPTTIVDSNIQSVNLTGDSGSISFTGCPGVLGVQDLTNLTTTLIAGESYSIDIEFGSCDGNYAGVGEAWIDFNNDQNFDLLESIGTWENTPPNGITTFNFTVPLDIVNGSTVMRVTQQEGGSLPINPCGSFQWGSVMDFTIVMTGGIDCSGFIGNDMNDPIIVTEIPYTNTHDNSLCYANNNDAYASPDVFYLITPGDSIIAVSVSLCGSSFDTYLSVFDVNGNAITFNDDGSCGAQSEVEFSTQNIDSAYIVVEGWGTEMGTYSISINKSIVLGTANNAIETIKYYPNPASDFFTITHLTTPNSTIQIFDLNGKLMSAHINYNGEKIDISSLEKSVYFLQVNESNFVKLIVN